MIMSRMFVFGVVLGVAAYVGVAADASAQVPAPKLLELPSVHSIAMPNGGRVVVRAGSTQRVTLVKGSLDYSKLEVTRGGVLVIDRCSLTCPRDYRFEVELQLPNVTGLSVANGGWIRSEGSFPPQAEIEIAVSNGGTIDTRSMVVDRVTASVDQGGRILTVPRVLLSATVSHGGVITYWGNARVRSSIEDGGSVARGAADEINASDPSMGVFMAR